MGTMHPVSHKDMYAQNPLGVLQHVFNYICIDASGILLSKENELPQKFQKITVGKLCPCKIMQRNLKMTGLKYFRLIAIT